jgi:hypothetical protein
MWEGVKDSVWWTVTNPVMKSLTSNHLKFAAFINDFSELPDDTAPRRRVIKHRRGCTVKSMRLSLHGRSSGLVYVPVQAIAPERSPCATMQGGPRM